MRVLPLFQKTAGKYCMMIFPEGEEERILGAANIALKMKLARPAFVWDRDSGCSEIQLFQEV